MARTRSDNEYGNKAEELDEGSPRRSDVSMEEDAAEEAEEQQERRRVSTDALADEVGSMQRERAEKQARRLLTETIRTEPTAGTLFDIYVDAATQESKLGRFLHSLAAGEAKLFLLDVVREANSQFAMPKELQKVLDASEARQWSFTEIWGRMLYGVHPTLYPSAVGAGLPFDVAPAAWQKETLASALKLLLELTERDPHKKQFAPKGIALANTVVRIAEWIPNRAVRDRLQALREFRPFTAGSPKTWGRHAEWTHTTAVRRLSDLIDTAKEVLDADWKVRLTPNGTSGGDGGGSSTGGGGGGAGGDRKRQRRTDANATNTRPSKPPGGVSFPPPPTDNRAAPTTAWSPVSSKAIAEWRTRHGVGPGVPSIKECDDKGRCWCCGGDHRVTHHYGTEEGRALRTQLRVERRAADQGKPGRSGAHQIHVTTPDTAELDPTGDIGAAWVSGTVIGPQGTTETPLLLDSGCDDTIVGLRTLNRIGAKPTTDGPPRWIENRATGSTSRSLGYVDIEADVGGTIIRLPNAVVVDDTGRPEETGLLVRNADLWRKGQRLEVIPEHGDHGGARMGDGHVVPLIPRSDASAATDIRVATGRLARSRRRRLAQAQRRASGRPAAEQQSQPPVTRVPPATEPSEGPLNEHGLVYEPGESWAAFMDRIAEAEARAGATDDEQEAEDSTRNPTSGTRDEPDTEWHPTDGTHTEAERPTAASGADGGGGTGGNSGGDGGGPPTKRGKDNEGDPPGEHDDDDEDLDEVPDLIDDEDADEDDDDEDDDADENAHNEGGDGGGPTTAGPDLPPHSATPRRVSTTTQLRLDTLQTLGTPDPLRTSWRDIKVPNWLKEPELEYLRDEVPRFEPIFRYGDKELDPLYLPALEHPMATVRLKLLPGVSPEELRQPIRRGSAEQAIRLAESRDQLASFGVIDPEPSSSPARSRVVYSAKKEGDARVNADVRLVNTKSVTDGYPTPNMHDIVEAATRSATRGTFDGRKAYWQFPIAPEDRYLTATHWGGPRFHEWQRGTMGLKNMPAVAQRFADHVLDPQDGSFLAYLDDFTVLQQPIEYAADGTTHGPDGRPHNFDVREMWARTRPTLERMLAEGYQLSARKSVLCATVTEVLGTAVGPGVHAPLPTRVEALSEMPRPVDKKTLMKFTGGMRFYATYVPRMSELLRPLDDLLLRTQRFEWTGEADQAFRQAKQALAAATTLEAPEPGCEWWLQTDYSSDANAGGYVILFRNHPGDTGGVTIQVNMPMKEASEGWRPYAFGMIRFPKTQHPPHAAHGELRVIYHALAQASELMGHRPTVGTDSKIAFERIQGADGKGPSSEMQRRWCAEISGQIGAVKHAECPMADVLSRNAECIRDQDAIRNTIGTQSSASRRRDAARRRSGAEANTTRPDSGSSEASCAHCDRPDDATDTMVQCEGCGAWAHEDCAGHPPAAQRWWCGSCVAQEIDEPCTSCSRSEAADDMIECDGCRRWTHKGCAGDPDARWGWWCAECVDAGLDRPCPQCDQSEQAEAMLQCDGCERWWHAGCGGVAEASLSLIEATEWHCPQCRGQDDRTQAEQDKEQQASAQAAGMATDQDNERRPRDKETTFEHRVWTPAQLLNVADAREEWKAEAEADPSLATCRTAASKGNKYEGVYPFWDTNTGLLMVALATPDTAEQAPKGSWRIVVPTSRRTGLMMAAHVHTGHQSEYPTTATVCRTFWWPGMTTDARTVVNSCEPCQRLRAVRKRAHMGPNIRTGTVPDEWLGVDVVEVGPCKYLSVVDAATTYLWTVRLPNMKSKSLVEALTLALAPAGGAPARLTMDQQFVDHEVQAFCASRGIRELTTPAHHPDARGFLERVHKDLRRAYDRIYMQYRSQLTQEQMVALATAATNGATGSNGAPSAYRQYHGREQRWPAATQFSVELARAAVDADEWDRADALLAAQGEAMEAARDTAQRKRRANERNRASRMAKDPKWRLGDRVRKWTPMRHGKHHVWRLGFTIVELSENGTTATLRSADGSLDTGVSTKLLDHEQTPLPMIFRGGQRNTPNSGTPIQNPWSGIDGLTLEESWALFDGLAPSARRRNRARLDTLAAQARAGAAIAARGDLPTTAAALRHERDRVSRLVAKKERQIRANQEKAAARADQAKAGSRDAVAANRLATAARANAARAAAYDHEMLALRRRLVLIAERLNAMGTDETEQAATRRNPRRQRR